MRTARIHRATRETDVWIRLKLDGRGKSAVKTGLPFLDHMLTLVATHGRFDLTVKAKGDLEVDIHHTNEDVGLVFGQAVHQALGDHAGIHRFGWCYVPMEEALARVVLDISGRPKLVVRDKRRLARPLRGSGTTYQWQDLEHWFESFTRTAKVTMHIDLFAGEEFHHTCEAIFKAFGRALAQAVARDPRMKGVPSSKGRL
ncbi:MAG: imidazoleglycerol-phosphate dehydratase HisB [Candidatus Omnitrophica bacterium]|nr:imidazoleglycerol-phosphate dehydratase HisB [Candidatus Omnitrophota bacterium]